MTKVEQIHNATMTILEQVGVKFHHPDAIAILEKHGIRTEGNVAYFTEGQIMEWVSKAPSTFTIYAPNPAYDMHIGGKGPNFGSACGCPIVSDKEGNKKNATLADFIKVMQLVETNPNYKLNGGLILQPEELPIDYAALLLCYASMTHSEKCMFLGGCGNYEQMELQMEMVSTYFGGVEAIREKPRMLTIVNMNTPLQLDLNMTESLITFAKYGQPICITSAAMAGSTSPVTLAGTIAMVNSEVLAGIALVQMVNPGSPVCYGSQSTAADMGTGAIAIGSPEGALCYRYAALMAQHYNLPCRAGGALSDSKVVDAQSGFESMITLQACLENKVDMVMQSAGILDGYTCFSFEKMMLDFEVVNYLSRYYQDMEVSEDTIPMDVIAKVGQDGMYLTEMHTFMNCRKEPCIPMVAARGACETPATRLMENIDRKMAQMIACYEKPVYDQEKMANVRKILEKLPIDPVLLDQIESM